MYLESNGRKAEEEKKKQDKFSFTYLFLKKDKTIVNIIYRFK